MTSFGTVTSPHWSAATVPLSPVEVVHLHSVPGFTLNFWQRRGVTSTVIVSLQRSFETVTDHLLSSSITSFQSKPRLMPPSRSLSSLLPLPMLLLRELLPKAG